MDRLLIELQKIDAETALRAGGKASGLSALSRAGLPVPEGCVLLRRPTTENEWRQVCDWWQATGSIPLAVRSSAVDEDSAARSFAGQHRSFLFVRDEASLRKAVCDCFESVQGRAGTAYRERFSIPAAAGETGMSVVLQRMIEPRFAGVYFTCDPLAREGAEVSVLEIVRGVGESLVSGSVTPARVRPGQALSAEASALGWTAALTDQIEAAAKIARASLGQELDIEWAVDDGGALWLLQARPITTLEAEARRTREQARELRRLTSLHSGDTLWDGQTFAEWTGAPTPLSFEIWRRAFSPAGSLGRALRELGYEAERSQAHFGGESVIDDVFGRAYVNLRKLGSLYFGQSPFVLEAKPRPHFEFRWGKLGLRPLLNAPSGTLRMARVAWRLSTGRRAILEASRSAHMRFDRQNRLPQEPRVYSGWDTESLLSRWEDLSSRFADEALVEPLKLMVAIEATQQSLIRIVGERRLGEWLGTRLVLPSLQMERELEAAAADPKLRSYFLSSHGHRAPGELDLSRPRWIELGAQAFLPQTDTLARATGPAEGTPPFSPSAGVRSRVAAQMSEDEWALLSSMLELREHWKDSIMRLYAHLRWVALELGHRLGWDEEVFWLRPAELRRLVRDEDQETKLRAITRRRRERQEGLQAVSLPLVFGLAELHKLDSSCDVDLVQGEALSDGLAYGEVRIVKDPAAVDWSRWPENAILVAEATDPGWTPLFARAKGIVTERGGTLSHCAIVAREMGLPAVSGIRGCVRELKEGENVWVDGTHGRIGRAGSR